MTIRTRLVAGFGAVLLVTAALLGLAVSHLHMLAGAGGTLVRDNVRSVLYAGRMAEAIERIDGAVLLRLAGGPARAAAQSTDARAAFARAITDERLNLTVVGEGAAADRVATAFAATDRAAARAATLAAYLADVRPATAHARDVTGDLRDLNLASMRAAAAAARESGMQAFWTVLLVGLGALAAGAAGAAGLAASLSAPLARATEAARRIGGGDLSVRLNEAAPGELADLARTMNAMTQRLRDVRDVNVAELRAEKRKADAILQALDDGVVVVDDRQRVAAFNPAARRVLGPDLRLGMALADGPNGERLDAHVRRSVHRAEALAEGARGAAADSAAPDSALADSAPAVPLLLPAATDAPGAEPTYEAVVSAVRGPFGPSAAVVLFHDVSPLRELDRLKSSFLMAASHELRTPLTGLKMSLGMLVRSPGVSERDRDLVAVAADEAERLSCLVADLLHLARAEAGQVRLDLRPVLVADALADLDARFAAQAAGQGIRLRVDASAAVAPVRADAETLGLVLSNLVTNALRYARADVSVVARESGGRVEIRVDDDGPGIRAEDRERVFHKFVQIDDGHAGGAGVGLALVRELVGLSGGRVSSGAAESGGASLRIDLPVW